MAFPWPRLTMLDLFTQVTGGRGAKELKDALMQQGVMVRHYATTGLEDYIRISVGRPEQTDILLEALSKC